MYQNVRPVLPAGAMKVCVIEESPLVGDDEPTRAAYVPPWGPEVVTAALPAAVQPASVPLSKPPLVMPLPTGAFTVRE